MSPAKMMKTLLICIWFIISSSSFVHSKSEELELSENVKDLEKTKGIFDAIKESNLVKTATQISKWGLPLLQSIGFFAKVISSSLKSESKELEFMKEQFKIINEKMDYVDKEFIEIKNLMDWNVVKIQYASYELHSNILKQQINELVDLPHSIKRIATDKFLLSYDHLYRNAAENLYQGFVNPNKIFSENLILAVRKFTKDYRSQIEKFFTGNIQLILKCLEIETFYMNMKNFSSAESRWQSQWERKLNNLTALMNVILEKITENWDPTSRTDIEDFNEVNSALSHEDYANKLYNFLNLKFRNRQWLVLVYDPLDLGTDHAIKVCNGVTQMQRRGHNIAVTSYPITGQPFEHTKYSSICSEIPKTIMTFNSYIPDYIFMKYVEPKLDCNFNQIGAVFRTNSVKYYITPSSRSVHCQYIGLCHIFGFYNYEALDIVFLG